MAHVLLVAAWAPPSLNMGAWLSTPRPLLEAPSPPPGLPAPARLLLAGPRTRDEEWLLQTTR